MTRFASRRLAGFSIVELLVAITIGAILLGGAVSLFVNNRVTYQVSTGLAHVQENARFAIDMMSRDIRMAGYIGCANDQRNVNDQTGATANDVWFPQFFLEGIDDATAAPLTWFPSGGSILGPEPIGNASAGGGSAGAMITGTDAITVRFFNGSFVDDWDKSGGAPGVAGTDGIPDTRVVGPTTSTSVTLNHFDAATFPNGGDIDQYPIGIADCGNIDVFIANGIPANDVITANTLSKTYSATANPTVAPFYAVRYYIGNNDETPPEPALYRETFTRVVGGLQEQQQELFEGVENMQILYGVDHSDEAGQPIPDGIVDAFVRAGQSDGAGADLTNGANNTWTRVIAIRMALVLRTDAFGRQGEGLEATQTYALLSGTAPANNAYDGQVIGPFDDRRRRRVFNVTIMARNMQQTN